MLDNYSLNRKILKVSYAFISKKLFLNAAFLGLHQNELEIRNYGIKQPIAIIPHGIKFKHL